jgi:hypothetical protein
LKIAYCCSKIYYKSSKELPNSVSTPPQQNTVRRRYAAYGFSEMSYPSDANILDQNQQFDLVDLVAEVTSALGPALKDSPLLYRDLRRSLALLVAEIRNIEILRALAQLHTLRQSLEKVAKSLNGALRSDYVKEKYQQLVAEEEVAKKTRRLSLFPSWFTSPTENYQKDGDKWADFPYPSLGMLRKLIQSPLWRELRIGGLLSDDRLLITGLTRLVSGWNSLVDQVYAGQAPEDKEDLTDKGYPKPLIKEAAFRGETSIRHLSQTLYDILHENWPCRFEEHDHNGRLGHCVGAKFCLDPQWSSRDPDPSRDSFFILLTSSDIIQECRVCLHTSR